VWPPELDLRGIWDAPPPPTNMINSYLHASPHQGKQASSGAGLLPGHRHPEVPRDETQVRGVCRGPSGWGGVGGSLAGCPPGLLPLPVSGGCLPGLAFLVERRRGAFLGRRPCLAPQRC
jgi:hypothetical protein